MRLNFQRLQRGLCLWLLVWVASSLVPAAAADRAPNSVWMEDLTWMELKARIDAGATSVILPTGGVEQNGPYITLGKHNWVVADAAQDVARALGHTLVAPVIKVVPQGSMEQPSGNLVFPGTLGLRDETFEHLLNDMVLSLAFAGFKRIYLMGDHGQSQPVQARVAERMSQLLKTLDIRVLHVAAYYQSELEAAYLEQQGISRTAQGEHAGVADTAQILAAQPQAVRTQALKRGHADLAALGGSGQPELATAQQGRALLALRVAAALREIRLAEESPR